MIDINNILACWGSTGLACPEPGTNTDVQPSGVVDMADILVVLNGWGPCP